tara:strand:- start:469 stop:1314 length:846 start_codon:yes stop_codon:yes gene_type:complete
MLKSHLFFSYAKLNLGLKIINKRADNYHNIKSYFIEINLCDEISFSESSEFKLTIEGLELLPDKNNLITKAYDLIRNKSSNINTEYAIHLKKKIPMGGGLGGGSSNAAATLVALNELWNLNLNSKKLELLGSELGADIPFFINGGTQLVEGLGNILSIVDSSSIKNYYFLLVVPPIHISTPWAYGKLNKSLMMDKSDLNFPPLSDSMKWELFDNDFERVIRKTHPEIGNIKSTMQDSGALFSDLSGSGSTVFGIFNSLHKANKILRKFPNYQTFITSPVFR